jgi:hypothetical protein
VKQRFILIKNEDEFPIDEETCWYWDTTRPLAKSKQPYIAMQCYCDKNPNEFIRHEALRLLFTDQAEYYAVCDNSYYTYCGMQWSGSTKNPGYREKSWKYLRRHLETKGWCEFCDPVFGNGGWIIGNGGWIR